MYLGLKSVFFRCFWALCKMRARYCNAIVLKKAIANLVGRAEIVTRLASGKIQTDTRKNTRS